MCIHRIGELLDFIGGFEDRVEDYYAMIRDGSGDNNARLLSYYLGRHPRRSCSVLRAFGVQKVRQLRWHELRRAIGIVSANWHTPPPNRPRDVTGKDLLAIAMRHNRRLVALYRSVLDQPLRREAALLIQRLKSMEEKESANFRRMLAMRYFG